MEEDAIKIGLNLDYFWSLTPKQWAKHVNVYIEKFEEDTKLRDRLNYYLAHYISIGVNSPKDFPKKPLLNQENKMHIQDDDAMEQMAMANSAMLGGVINGNNN